MTRNFLGLALASSVAMVSCTAILGGVPTTGGSGGGGDASTGSGTGALGAGGSGAAGGTSSPNGGSGGVTGNGGAGMGGGSGGCLSKDAMCSGNATKCCSGLVCGTSGTCEADNTSSSTGSPACHTCNAVLMDPMLINSLCSVSKLKYNALRQCACTSCPQSCGTTCNGGAVTQACETCAMSACKDYITACATDQDCNKCSEMLLLNDVNKSDVCNGMSTTLFQSWFDCVCIQNTQCDACAMYCTTGVISAACAMCAEGQSSHCLGDYNQCEADN